MPFSYKSFLGYRQGADGKPEIDPAQAVTVRRIYTDFLSGKSLQQIADGLTADSIPTPMGKTVWQPGVIQSILSNVKYKGDALLGKTYIEDSISKKVRINAGECVQYYVENNHPAIIDFSTSAGRTCKASLETQGQADRHDNRTGQILRKVCAHRTACLWRMRNAIPQMHLDCK